MRRVLAILAVVVAAVALVVFATGSGDDSGTYRVRAIFDNAAFVIPGEDVKIGGVKVGSIESLDVTPNKKAAVVLAIQDTGFHDFRRDATCTIRPESLIGEKFVECQPTKPRVPGTPPPPLLPQIDRGPGKGQYLLPSTNTRKAIDLDLINNIARLPLRQRFTIIINELGTGLAGNGQALNTALKKSDPALQALDDVLRVLAEQNKTLATLVDDGSAVLAPLARNRARVTGFINSSAKTAQATAEKSAALEEDLRLLPKFLAELTPTMNRLGDFSTAFTPIVQDLHRAAPALNTFTTGTPAFTSAATTSLTSLGKTAETGGPALEASLPLVKDLGALGSVAKPLSRNLNLLLSSLRATGGIDRLMDFAFYGAGGINGFDQYGHYLRARLVLTTCQTYVQVNQLGCTANFNKDLGATTSPPASGLPASASSASTATVAQASAATKAGGGGTSAAVATNAIKLPKTLLPGDDGVQRGAGAVTRTAAPKSAPDQRSVQSLLDYLLGQ